ncbi:helix-turn-helix domain-containing protein [Streptomyces sp. NPDC055722]
MVPQAADELRRSQKTVRRWLHRFNRCEPEGLEDQGGQGRKRRITEAERSRIVGLVKLTPPGRLEMQPSGAGPPSRRPSPGQGGHRGGDERGPV